MNPAYQRAFDAYDRCIDTIRFLADTANRVLRSRNSSERIDDDTILFNFDAILQYSLMQVAVNDYEFSVEEARFLKDLAQYCDFCDYLESISDKHVNWDLFLNCNASAIKELLELDSICEDIRDKAEALSTLFAMIDAVTPDTDYYESFKNDFFKILYAMTLADGESEACEAEGCFFLEFLAMISINKEEKEKEYFHEKSSSSSTLRDFYLKKKR